MNVGKSLKMALAKRDMNQTQLAEKMKCTSIWINRLANSQSASMGTVMLLAEALDMKASEFLAMGED